jgi:hypothetical protein
MRVKIVGELQSLRTDLAKMIILIDADIERFQGKKTAKPVHERVTALRVKEPFTPQDTFTFPFWRVFLKLVAA